MISERLQKVINMAKNGLGNEKLVAERLARRECEKLGISYEDAISGKTSHSGDSGPFKWGNRTGFRGFDDIPKNRGPYGWEENFTRKWNEQQEFEELRRKEAQRRASTVRDKLGGLWSFNEIMKISREKRIHLFGKDPLVGDW